MSPTLGLKADITLVSANEVLNAVNRGEPLVRAYSGSPEQQDAGRFAAHSGRVSSATMNLATDTGERKSGRLRLRKG